MFNLSRPKKRLPLIRLYTCLAFLASVFVTVAGVLEAVSYFVFAVCLLTSTWFTRLQSIVQEDLMYECVALAITGQSYEKSTFVSSYNPRITI